MTKRKPSKMTENERLHILLSIAERKVQNLLKTPEWTQIAKLTADYRDLETENRRLRVSSFVTAVPSEDYEKLKAENERLRKAGDELSIALAAFHLLHRGRIDTTTQPDIVAWHAAKGGKPSV